MEHSSDAAIARVVAEVPVGPCPRACDGEIRAPQFSLPKTLNLPYMSSAITITSVLRNGVIAAVASGPTSGQTTVSWLLNVWDGNSPCGSDFGSAFSGRWSITMNFFSSASVKLPLYVADVGRSRSSRSNVGKATTSDFATTKIRLRIPGLTGRPSHHGIDLSIDVHFMSYEFRSLGV